MAPIVAAGISSLLEMGFWARKNAGRDARSDFFLRSRSEKSFSLSLESRVFLPPFAPTPLHLGPTLEHPWQSSNIGHLGRLPKDTQRAVHHVNCERKKEKKRAPKERWRGKEEEAAAVWLTIFTWSIKLSCTRLSFALSWSPTFEGSKMLIFCSVLHAILFLSVSTGLNNGEKTYSGLVFALLGPQTPSVVGDKYKVRNYAAGILLYESSFVLYFPFCLSFLYCY